MFSICNNLQKQTPKKVASHSNNIQDLCCRVKYLKGDRMPCDFGSWNRHPIDHLTQQEQESLGYDIGNDVYVRKITNLGNLPNVLDTDQLRKAAFLDPKYQQLVKAVNNGDSLPPQ